jgi:hypothetical protein
MPPLLVLWLMLLLLLGLPPHSHGARKHRLVDDSSGQAAPVVVDVHRCQQMRLLLMLM